MHKINCSIEAGNTNHYTDLGSSPKLLQNLCEWLKSYKKQILSVDIAWYLFNNAYFFSVLEDLLKYDCKINIYSIPLEGYDATKPMKIFSHSSNECIGDFTKFDLANKIYHRIQQITNPNLKLYIMPHMYIRSASVNPFSRGSMPYSLHLKSFMVQFKDGNVYAGLSSSNFAVRDASKIELACALLLGERDKNATIDFYNGLRENSIEINKFNENTDYTHYKIAKRRKIRSSQTRYIAPFYENSAIDFENDLIRLIKNAQHRIIIAAQHVCAYDYTYLERYASESNSDKVIRKSGILTYILQKASEGINVTVLSQTYADNEERPKVRKPQNVNAFIKFAEAAKKIKNCHYYVNSDLHAKYIIIDNIAILTTCNFTPTQFIYLPNVNILKFKKIPDLTYSGIFCEFGAYYMTDNAETIQRLEKYTSKIIGLNKTQKFI